MERQRVYFVSDVHLGLNVCDPDERERRFVKFLREIPSDSTASLYLLGDIWDFWYEYHDVVPKGSVRVFAALMDLIAAGVEVVFFPGNHDMWTYGYLESMGIKIVDQPFFVTLGGKNFCLGHGDGLGPGMRGYKMMKAVMRNGVARALFSSLHPRLSFAFSRKWSEKGRLAHGEKYIFRGADEPLYKYAVNVLSRRNIDYFIFGHFHTSYDAELPGGARLMILPDWLEDSDYLYFDGISVRLGHSRNTE